MTPFEKKYFAQEAHMKIITTLQSYDDDICEIATTSMMLTCMMRKRRSKEDVLKIISEKWDLLNERS